MARDQKKRQKKLMKKRQKDKQRKQRVATDLLKPQTIIRRARDFPISECLINADWRDEDGSGFARIMLARQQPNGSTLLASYLVDTYCLGLKDTLYHTDLSQAEYRDFIAKLYHDAQTIACPLDLAHQIIYQAIDYAAQFGFKPQKDFKQTRHMLEERGKLPEDHKLAFGKDGKPFFVAGPYDNPRAILAKLEKHAGAGNYDYLVDVNTIPFDDDFDLLPDDLD